MAKQVGAVLVMILYLAVLFLLVRPRSQGPALVNSVTGGLVSLLTSVTGGGGFK